MGEKAGKENQRKLQNEDYLAVNIYYFWPFFEEVGDIREEVQGVGEKNEPEEAKKEADEFESGFG